MSQDALQTGLSRTVEQYGGGYRPNILAELLEVHRSDTLPVPKQWVNVTKNPVEAVTGRETQRRTGLKISREIGSLSSRSES